MTEKSARRWTVRELLDAPLRGVWRPGRPRHGPYLLVQRNVWVLLDAAAALLVVVLLLAWAIHALLMGAAGEAHRVGGDPFHLLILCLLAEAGFFARYVLTPVAWGLNRQTGEGWIVRGGRPFQRRWEFPLSAVRRVVHEVPDPANDARGGIGLELLDAESNAFALPLRFSRRPDRLEQEAQWVAEWLGVKVQRQIACQDPIEPLADAEPVRAPREPRSRFRGNALYRRASGTRLHVGPSIGVWVLSLLALGAGLWIAAAMRPWRALWPWAPVDPVARVVSLSVSVAALSVSPLILLYMGRFVLDRRAGVLRCRHGILPGARPIALAEITAVETTIGGSARSFGAGGHRLFELNVVRECGRRVNLIRNQYPAGVRIAGLRVATFLDVPLRNDIGPVLQ